MEKILTGLRHPHREPHLRRERVITEFPEGRRRNAFQFSDRTPRSRAADDIFFGYVGGRHHGGIKISRPDVCRGENGIWDIKGTLGSRSINAPLDPPGGQLGCFGSRFLIANTSLSSVRLLLRLFAGRTIASVFPYRTGGLGMIFDCHPGIAVHGSPIEHPLR